MTAIVGRQLSRLAATTVLALGLGGQPVAAAALNVMLQQEPSILVAGIDTGGIVQTIAGGKIFQGLFNYDTELNPVPVLAESWDVSDDGLIYTFNLRRNARWHDGEPFTADDVVFSAGTLLPETHGRTRGILQRVETIEKIDDHTVRFVLKEPFLPFMSGIVSVNLPILPRHLYEGTDFRQNPNNIAPVGTGPFKFKEWRRGEYVHLVRNDDYYMDGLPLLDEIYFHILPDGSQRAIALETGKVDVSMSLNLDAHDEDRLIATGDFKAFTGAYDGVGAVTMAMINQREHPYSDRRFRQALAHAIDREFIVDAIVMGRGRVAHGPIASPTAYFDGDALHRYDHDPDKAEALLDEMGLVRGPNGVRHSLEFMMTAGGAGVNLRISEYIKQALAEIGLEVTLVSPDRATYVRKDTEWDYEIALHGLGQFLDPAIGVARNYLTSHILNAFQNNTSGYSNPRVDELWAKAIGALSAEEAQIYYSEIQSILTEDAAALWIYERDDWIIARSDIENLVLGPFAAYYEWGTVDFKP
jgi:peptide/nickel transport system substrate-binding protein